MERILLLTMGFGMGHNAVAHTLKQEFIANGHQVELVDLLELGPNRFPILQSGYHGMLNKLPTLYHVLYDFTTNYRLFRFVSSEFIGKLGLTIRKRLTRIYHEFQPTKIVSTHPFSLLVCPAFFRSVPTIGVVTDFEIHPLWFGRVPEVLCFPKHLQKNRQLEQTAWRLGVKLVQTGLPINDAFYHQGNRQQIIAELGLDERPVIIIMGGGAGLGPLEQIVQEIRSPELAHLQFIVLTGNNRLLYQRLVGQRLHGRADHVFIEPFRSDIPDLMDIADLLVTKPGGVTISEAIAKQLPMFLFQAFPGQEEANQKYLLHHRIAVVTRPSTICLQIQKYFNANYKRGQIKHRFPILQTPNAAYDILQEVQQTSKLIKSWGRTN